MPDLTSKQFYRKVFFRHGLLADPLAPHSLMMKSLTISAGALYNYTATRDELLRRARDVFAGLREGWLKLHIDRTFPLAQAAEAHQLLESRQTAGKLTLKTH
jgi:NADPH2:quinone reductase